MSRLRGALGVELALRELFEEPTVEGLARRVEGMLRAGAALATPPLVPVAREGALPLSFAQQRLWFLDRLEPEGPLYNVPVALRVEGRLDVAALGWSLGEIVRRHEALRTVFRAVAGEPRQVIVPAVELALPRVDLSALGGDRGGALARRLAVEEAARPFRLSTGPLLRAVLLRLGEDDHAVLVTLHHIVSDGWSMGLLVGEIAALYGARTRGLPSPLAALPVQYADFSAWQRSWLHGATLERGGVALAPGAGGPAAAAGAAGRPAAPRGAEPPGGGAGGGALPRAEPAGAGAGA